MHNNPGNNQDKVPSCRTGAIVGTTLGRRKFCSQKCSAHSKFSCTPFSPLAEPLFATFPFSAHAVYSLAVSAEPLADPLLYFPLAVASYAIHKYSSRCNQWQGGRSRNYYTQTGRDNGMDSSTDRRNASNSMHSRDTEGNNSSHTRYMRSQCHMNY
jgi:hypothetical protein